jgi:hypothetical protein
MIQVLVTKWRHDSCNIGKALEGNSLDQVGGNEVSWQFSRAAQTSLVRVLAFDTA